MNWEKIKNRYSIVMIFIILTGLIYIYKLMQLQIVHGEEYKKQSDQRLLKTVSVKPARGEIFDRYGRPLATNRMGFSIQIHKTDTTEQELNDVLLNLLNAINQNETVYIDRFPISNEPPFEFQFLDTENITKEEQEAKWKQSHKLDINLTPYQVIEVLKKRYRIADKYTDAEVRKIIGIRGEMKERAFGIHNPFTVATDVNEHIVMQLEECHLDFPGVNVNVEPIRNYVNGELAAHILGRVGIIYAEEYKELKSNGYQMNDILGKDGIEKILEPYLRGKEGKKRIEQNVDGKVTRELGRTLSVPGYNAILTLDAELQKAAEKSLHENILRIREEAEEEIRRNPNKKNIGEDASGGAVAVIDIRSGEILAMATYPTYDPSRFNEDYIKLHNDPLRPMFNRVISGIYSPGSTFKPLTALAALEENIISPNEKILDKGKYMFYSDSGYTPRCWLYQEKYGYMTHGYVNVSEALRDSCNYFFYDVGRRLTIQKINEYAKKFGLGELTGIELPGENRGILGGPESKKKLYNQPWYPGETLGAAIGEMHAFTPIQLASYVSTLANYGVRYKAHLIKYVKTYDDGEKIVEVKPEILSKADLNPDNVYAVFKGMRSVTGEDGTASHAFKNFPIPVAGKTGSAQMMNSSDNGVFVGFAPYDNPQIAIAVIIEHGRSGSNTAPVARDIFAAYFGVDKIQNDDNLSINNMIP